jgi:general secretion pathway protein D
MQFNTVIRALKQKQSTDILSAPKVTTVTGSTATIKMVDIRYFPEGWTEPELQAASGGGNNGGVTGASFRPSTPEFGAPTEIGVILTVTPTVGSDGYSINLELEPVVREKIGDDDYSYNINLGAGGDAGAITATVPLRQPIISEREVQTNVIVWDGETVVLGGMIRENLEEIDDRVPFLGELPIVGKLFRVKREVSLKRNLLIFVSARLVNPAGLPIRTADIRGLPDFRR